jgi:hypothetical protein
MAVVLVAPLSAHMMHLHRQFYQLLKALNVISPLALVWHLTRIQTTLGVVAFVMGESREK